MELTLLFLSFLVSTSRNTFCPVIFDSFTSFDHGEFLDGNVCPEGKAIQTTGLYNDVKCLFQCRDQTSCNGLFWDPDAMQCVTCSQNCEDLGGHLLILNSEEEMDFIYPYLVVEPDVHDIYIGANGIGGEATTFEWVDGSNVSEGYTNWQADVYDIYNGANGIGGEATTFEWVDEYIVSAGYTNWQFGAQYPLNSNKKYVYMRKDWNYKWIDDFDSGRESICEFD